MRSVRISLKTARYLVGVLGLSNHSGDQSAVRELRRAMEPKRSVKLAKVRKTAKRATKKEETAAIREAVMARADGRCEDCGSSGCPLELDHAFGRGHVQQTERNCWALCGPCHREKTNNRPNAAYWLKRFTLHAQKHNLTREQQMALRRLAFVEARAAFGNTGGHI